MELARGQVTDRPWGMTLGALGARRLTGQLTLQAEGKQYCLAFDQGAVVGATSPLASDAAPRIALIHHLIAPAHVPDLTRRIAAAPKRDEIELIAEVARLTVEQAAKLRRWVLEQRAARTFSVDAGAFAIDSIVGVPIQGGLSLDVRGVIYQGARVNLSELRLGNELRQLGVQFVLAPDAADQLGAFGFTDAERPILEALRAGTTVAELEARHRELDPRTIQAVIYALASCAVCTGITPPSLRDVSEAAANDFAVTRRPPAATPSDVYSRTRTGRDVFVTRAPTPPPTAARAPTATAPGTSRPPGASRAPAAAPDETGVPRARGAARPRPGSGERPPAAARSGPAPKPDAPATPRTQTPVTPVAARAPTPASPRTPTPNSAPAAGRTPTPAAVGRAPTPASIGRAPTPASIGRAPTPAGVARTRSSNIPINTRTRTTARVLTAVAPPADAEAAPGTDPAAAAREAYKRGLSRLRVENLEDAILDLTRAVDLQPNEVDYAATLAWARFCHTTDKASLAQATREALARAIRKSQSPEMARFYLGRVERMLGRDKEALRHFQEVLEAQPKHADAAAEVRAIEARMATAAAKESGVFGRKR